MDLGEPEALIVPATIGVTEEDGDGAPIVLPRSNAASATRRPSPRPRIAALTITPSQTDYREAIALDLDFRDDATTERSRRRSSHR